MKAVGAEARVAAVAKVEDAVKVAAEARVAGAGLLPSPASSPGASAIVASGRPFLSGPGQAVAHGAVYQPVG